jgi:serine/threonine protein kinase
VQTNIQTNNNSTATRHQRLLAPAAAAATASFSSSSSSSSSFLLSSSPSSHLTVRDHGMVLERCLGSLSDVYETDKYFDYEMRLIEGGMVREAFTWQRSELSMHVNRAAGAHARRPLFSDLCVASCQRLIGELRSPSHLLTHMLHLTHALDYIHSHGIVHQDIKPHNLFVRVNHSTNNQVTKLQLILADFDHAAVFPLNTTNNNTHTNTNTNITNTHNHSQTVNWHSHIPASSGTFGFHPNLFHPHIQLQSAIHYLLPNHTHKQNKQANAEQNTQQQQHLKSKQLNKDGKVGEETYISMYRSIHPFATTSVDVYSLGMIFLTMLYRLNFVPSIVLWVKAEMSECNLYARSFVLPTFSHSFSHCTPACVLLFHSGEVWRKSEISEYQLDASRHSVFPTRHREVVEAVAEERVHPYLPQLLQWMTDNEPQQRPTPQQCTQVLQSILRSILPTNKKRNANEGGIE